jgi:hypothetical protein
MSTLIDWRQGILCGQNVFEFGLRLASHVAAAGGSAEGKNLGCAPRGTHSQNPKRFLRSGKRF